MSRVGQVWMQRYTSRHVSYEDVFLILGTTSRGEYRLVDLYTGRHDSVNMHAIDDPDGEACIWSRLA